MPCHTTINVPSTRNWKAPPVVSLPNDLSRTNVSSPASTASNSAARLASSPTRADCERLITFLMLGVELARATLSCEEPAAAAALSAAASSPVETLGSGAAARTPSAPPPRLRPPAASAGTTRLMLRRRSSPAAGSPSRQHRQSRHPLYTYLLEYSSTYSSTQCTMVPEYSSTQALAIANWISGFILEEYSSTYTYVYHGSGACGWKFVRPSVRLQCVHVY